MGLRRGITISLLFLASVLGVSGQEPNKRDPGLTETSIRVGTPIPGSGPLVEVGLTMRGVVKAYFDEVNSRGGVDGRRIELILTPTENDPDVLASARRLIKEEKVFALVGGIIAGVEREATTLAQTEEMPLIGPATLNPTLDIPMNRYVFYLLPGMKEQARALVNFAATKADTKKSSAAIVFQAGGLNGVSASAVEEQARKLGWNAVSSISFSPNDFAVAQLVNELKGKGIESVFFFGSSSDLKSLIERSQQTGWTPRIYSSGATAGLEWSAVVTPAFKDRIFLSFPTVPSDITAAATAEYRALKDKYNLPAKHVASQLSALAAAKLFVEGLKRAGELRNSQSAIPNPKSEIRNSAKLIAALEGLRDFETGFTPRVTFGPDRRLGAMGAYMITFDPDAKQLVPASGWIPVN